MKKYLYGASVQGIQGFIFQTNALKEIAGASEIVEQICTSAFAEAINKDAQQLTNDPNAIVTAAGNIKYVFDSEDKCRDLVKLFPMKIMEFAPGITISQAVVCIEDGKAIGKEHIDLLEKKLRTQRNKPFRPYDLGLMGVNRSRKTGLPAYEEKKIKGTWTIIDKGVAKKLEREPGRVAKSFFGESNLRKIPLDMADITDSKGNGYSWLAVIHADGNNLGMIIQQLADKVEHVSGNEFINTFRTFSVALNAATIIAANLAYKETLKEINLVDELKLPFRPIVIGGDDLTVICRADLALTFGKLFLEFFERETQAQLSALDFEFLKGGLTACAGIAYIKASYPFHYGYHFAEALCAHAKKEAKVGLGVDEPTPSCIQFHKVQDSFVENYDAIRERELIAGTKRFDYGPYYLHANGKPSIEKLQENVALFNGREGNAVKSHLRQWLTDLHSNEELAEQKINRLISAATNPTQEILKKLGLPQNATDNNPTPVYDWLTINSINQGGN